MQSKQQFVGIDPKLLERPRASLANIFNDYLLARKAFALSSFVGINESSPALLLFPGGCENEVRGRFERKGDSAGVEWRLAIDGFSEGSQGPWTSTRGVPKKETTLKSSKSEVLRRKKARWSLDKARVIHRAQRLSLSPSRVRSRHECGL